VQNALIEHGIAQPQPTPFQAASSPTDDINDNNDILDPDLPIPVAGEFPHGIENLAPPSQPTTLFTGPVSEIADDDLDMFLLHLCTHYWHTGLSMLNGMLHRLGHHVPTERVHQSLLQIDPVHQIFEHIQIHH
jgi:hypothetical protein